MEESGLWDTSYGKLSGWDRVSDLGSESLTSNRVPLDHKGV